MTRPVLSKYPHLRHILKNDAVANTQFNQAIAEVSNGYAPAVASASKSSASNERRANEYFEKYEELRKTLRKQQDIITRLGEAIEPQTHLRPYTQDLADKSSYEITIGAQDIRNILALHWELLAERSEALIRGDKSLTEEET